MNATLMQIYTALRKHAALSRFRFAPLVSDELRGQAKRLPQKHRDLYHLAEAFGQHKVLDAAVDVARRHGGAIPEAIEPSKDK